MSAAQPAPVVSSAEPVGNARGVRRALSGFFLSGVLMSFLGAILPAWQAHLTQDFTDIGKYFLALGLGIFSGLRLARRLLPGRGVAFCLVAASALASFAFLFLAFMAPPALELWRLTGILLTGVSAAVLNSALFHALAPLYERDRAATLNLAAAMFGLGCLVTALLVAQTFYALRVPGILLLLAALPLVFVWLYARVKYPAAQFAAPPRRQTLRDLQTPLALLLGLLLFFQFGSEWSIAGWLPLFLIRRLGSSPATAVLLLAGYWTALFAGRIAAQAVMLRATHPRLLLGSVLVELLGYLLLCATNNLFGASVGILCLSAGYSVTYPLVVEKIGPRFPHYHPVFFHGIFSVAFTGALLAPWLLGYLAQAWGIVSVMLLPLLGTLAVFALILLILLESYLSGWRSHSRAV